MKCTWCGKNFIQRTATNRYCSQDCRSEAYRDRISQVACRMPNCTAKVNAWGEQLCSFHYRLWQEGLPDRERLIRERGTGTISMKGYVVVIINGQSFLEHRLLAEKALGKKLPEGACVHHMNEKPWDNYTPFNLVVCPNDEYHKLLHKRAKELGYGQDN